MTYAVRQDSRKTSIAVQKTQAVLGKTEAPDPRVVGLQQHGEKDPSGLDQHAPGAKLDAGKTMPWLCISGFSHALAAVADVTTKGALKYTPNGWVQVADGEQRYMEAFGRHLLATGRGEVIDRDTGCLHKAQMIWNLLASLELELRRENGHGRNT